MIYVLLAVVAVIIGEWFWAHKKYYKIMDLLQDIEADTAYEFDAVDKIIKNQIATNAVFDIIIDNLRKAEEQRKEALDEFNKSWTTNVPDVPSGTMGYPAYTKKEQQERLRKELQDSGYIQPKVKPAGDKKTPTGSHIGSKCKQGDFLKDGKPPEMQVGDTVLAMVLPHETPAGLKYLIGRKIRVVFHANFKKWNYHYPKISKAVYTADELHFYKDTLKRKGEK